MWAGGEGGQHLDVRMEEALETGATTAKSGMAASIAAVTLAGETPSWSVAAPAARAALALGRPGSDCGRRELPWEAKRLSARELSA